MVDLMLRYFYAREHQHQNFGDPRSLSLVREATLYGVADKYGVGPLKDQAKHSFEAVLKNWKATIEDFMPNLLEAIEVVYSTTPVSDRGLRCELLIFLEDIKTTLIKDEGFMRLFKSDLADGDFTVDVLKVWSNLTDDGEQKEWICSNCPFEAHEYELTFSCARCFRTHSRLPTALTSDDSSEE